MPFVFSVFNPFDAGLGQLMTFWENLPVAADLAESRE